MNITTPQLTLHIVLDSHAGYRHLVADATDLDACVEVYRKASDLYDWDILDFWCDGFDGPKVDGGIIPDVEDVVVEARATAATQLIDRVWEYSVFTD
jgi:hypothetical protein